MRADTAETRSWAGRRSIGLPDELVALLRKHRDEQDQERATAAQLWEGSDWLFATPTGGPVNPRTDLTAQVRRDIAQRVGGLLGDSPAEDPKRGP
ncbi:hypothetical protein [Micromonospora kangleipakensis]|uniref:hypothetical protein n=1 Tax=Micromonospora kangleipakensis TaxID=1077942 RepID=UPI001F5F4275|nr:hypothetical protein [Micromonospora kangleipakensis]